MSRSAAEEEGRKVYVGGLPYECTDDDLSNFLAGKNFTDIEKAEVILDRESGRSRGFGFVTFDSKESASRCVDDVNEQSMAMDGNERRLKVDLAGKGGGGGGGRGGGRGRGGRGGGGYRGGRDGGYRSHPYGGGDRRGGGGRYGDRDSYSSGGRSRDNGYSGGGGGYSSGGGYGGGSSYSGGGGGGGYY